MADPSARPANPGRRIVLKAGLVGVGLLAAAGVWRAVEGIGADAPATGYGYLEPNDLVIFRAIAPAMLDGALPETGRDEALAAVLSGVDTVIVNLAPETQAELRKLLDLLAIGPTRLALTGVWRGFDGTSANQVAGMLERWSGSSLSLLQRAYIGFHDIVVAAWYGDPRSWAALGYDGPPEIPDEVRRIV